MAQLKDVINIVSDKSESKDWQEKEIALKEVEHLYKDVSTPEEIKLATEPELLNTIVSLLKGCLDANNMTIYLVAVDATHYFFLKTLANPIVMTNLESLIEPIIMRTTDTNTRVRKKSVDLVFQVWNTKPKGQAEMNAIFGSKEQASNQSAPKIENIGSIMASVICNPDIGEKSIIGRLGLFIKRA